MLSSSPTRGLSSLSFSFSLPPSLSLSLSFAEYWLLASPDGPPPAPARPPHGPFATPPLITPYPGLLDATLSTLLTRLASAITAKQTTASSLLLVAVDTPPAQILPSYLPDVPATETPLSSSSSSSAVACIDATRDPAGWWSTENPPHLPANPSRSTASEYASPPRRTTCDGLLAPGGLKRLRASLLPHLDLSSPSPAPSPAPVSSSLSSHPTPRSVLLVVHSLSSLLLHHGTHDVFSLLDDLRAHPATFGVVLSLHGPASGLVSASVPRLDLDLDLDLDLTSGRISRSPRPPSPLPRRVSDWGWRAHLESHAGAVARLTPLAPLLTHAFQSHDAGQPTAVLEVEAASRRPWGGTPLRSDRQAVWVEWVGVGVDVASAGPGSSASTREGFRLPRNSAGGGGRRGGRGGGVWRLRMENLPKTLRVADAKTLASRALHGETLVGVAMAMATSDDQGATGGGVDHPGDSGWDVSSDRPDRPGATERSRERRERREREEERESAWRRGERQMGDVVEERRRGPTTAGVGSMRLGRTEAEQAAKDGVVLSFEHGGRGKYADTDFTSYLPPAAGGTGEGRPLEGAGRLGHILYVRDSDEEYDSDEDPDDDLDI